jgi:hypothetical protein
MAQNAKSDKNSEKKISEFFTYKGKPLVRCDDTLYYGNMNDEYVIKMDIRSKEKSNDLDMATSVSIQLISTDPEVSIRKKIIKTSQKDSLYLALDIADVWLERALS